MLKGLIAVGVGLLVLNQLAKGKELTLNTPESILRYARSGELARAWWQLTDKQRYDTATLLIDNFQGRAGFIQQFYTPAGSVQQGWCVNNATARYEQFNGSKFIDEGYTYGNGIAVKVYDSYKLPVYLADLDNPWHTVAAIQIRQDKSLLESWRFFQYTENDIKPGESWQMQTPVNIKIRDVIEVRLNSYTYSNQDIVQFAR